MENEKLTYSNPRMEATIEDWPSGSRRVTAVFKIEQHPKKGERATRVTSGAPKKLTYVIKARIVEGSDGRTYIAELSMYGHIHIMGGTMKYSKETIQPTDERFGEVRTLFD